MLIFIWQETPLKDFTFQAIGLLVVIFVALSIVMGRKGKRLSLNRTVGIIILNTIIVLLIFATGDFSSPFFFLVYLIILALVFVFEPYSIIAFCTGAVLIFIPTALQGDIFSNFIKLGSIILVSPLAFFFGKEFHKSKAEEVAKHEDIIDEIKKDVKEVLEKEEKLNKHDRDKLSQAVKKAEKLKEDYEETL